MNNIYEIVTKRCKEKITKLKREEIFDFEYTIKNYDTLVEILKEYENIKKNKRNTRQDLPYKILFDYLNNARKFNIFWLDDKFDKEHFDKLDLTDEEKQRLTELQIQQIKKNISIIDLYMDCINKQIEEEAIPKIQAKIKSYKTQKTAKNTNIKNINTDIPTSINTDIPTSIKTKRNTRKNAKRDKVLEKKNKAVEKRNKALNKALEELKILRKIFRSRKTRTVNPLNPFSKRYILTPKQNKDFEAFFNPYLFAKSI